MWRGTSVSLSWKQPLLELDQWDLWNGRSQKALLLCREHLAQTFFHTIVSYHHQQHPNIIKKVIRAHGLPNLFFSSHLLYISIISVLPLCLDPFCLFLFNDYDLVAHLLCGPPLIDYILYLTNERLKGIFLCLGTQNDFGFWVFWLHWG